MDGKLPALRIGMWGHYVSEHVSLTTAYLLSLPRWRPLSDNRIATDCRIRHFISLIRRLWLCTMRNILFTGMMICTISATTGACHGFDFSTLGFARSFSLYTIHGVASFVNYRIDQIF
uniref:Uncharacterized protein n=1 Tax=Rhipicephalus microplus TaxID=6941 RepID=A0A6G5AGL8_RHIMP